MSNALPRSSLTINAASLLVARTIAFAFSLALPLFLVRHLNQMDFGVYKQAFLFVNSAVTLLSLGFGMSALYFLPRESDKQGYIVLNIALFNVGVAGALCLALIVRPSIVHLIFRSSELVPLAAGLGVVILLWTAASSFDLIAVARNEMKTAGGIIVFVQLSRTALFLGAAILFGSVRALVFAAILQGALQAIGFLFYLQARFPGFWRHFDETMMRQQLSYVVPLATASLLYSLIVDLHNYVVSYRFGPALYAVYAIGTVQLPLVNMLQEVTNSVLLPRISLLQQSHESREIVLQMARAMRKLAVAYVPIFALLLVVGREFIRFLFTDRYLDSWPIFAVNLTLLLISTILTDPLCRAYLEQRYYLIGLRAVLLIAMVPLLWFGASRFGLVGVISTVVAVVLLERVIVISRFVRILGVTWNDIVLMKDFGKIALASAAAALVTAVVRGQILTLKPFFILAGCGTTFAAIYVLCVFLLGVPLEEEWRFGKLVQLWRLR